MPQLRLDFGSIYSEEEARVLRPSQRIRQRLLAPLAAALVRLGISADMLSAASVILSIGFCVLVPFQFTWAFWLFAASLVCDGLDGVVARQAKKNTAAGSYTDLFCDQTVVAFCTVGMVWRGDIYPALAVLFIFTDTALSIQLVLHHLLQVSSRWIVRPGKTLFSIAIGLDFFFHINLLNYLLLAYLLTLLLLVISFRRLRKAL